MGGGSDLSMPPVSGQQDITLGGDVHSNLGFTCGFNPSVSIGNTLNHIQDSLQGISQSVIRSATSAVGSLPMYLLAHTNKDLYNLIQNTMTGAMDTFHLHQRTCQNALSRIKKGDASVYQNWFSISDSQGWLNFSKRAQQGQDVDVNQASKALTKDPHQYGIPWVHKGQNSGGTQGDQVPITVIYDVVVAGYNAMVDPNSPLDAKGTVATPNSGLSRYWQNADAAGQWARLVLGDITISSKPGIDNTTRGTGLMTLVQTCPKSATNTLTCAHTLATQLTTLVNNSGTPDAKALRAVSSNEMLITPAVIQGIRNKTPQEQALAISKLSQDIALQNVVDEALILRRVLITGSQTKPVHNLKPALNAINQALGQLNRDIQNILFQFQVRKALMTNTAEAIIGSQQQREAEAVGEHNTTQPAGLVNGAVYKTKQTP